MQTTPLGFLDLIPCGPSPPHNRDDAFHLEPHIWGHLPENLLHSILSLLPFQSVLRFRCVCKQWKALFASPAFHHFASWRSHVPPLIFFTGSTASRFHNGNRDALNHNDDTIIEPLLLIFDCESESWRRPLALPPAFKRTTAWDPACLPGCTFQEQVLIFSITPFRFFLFNPASPPCKELPPCIAIQSLETFGFAEERTTLSDTVTWPNRSDLFSMSNQKEPPRVQEAKTAKVLQVVAVGATINGTNIVESFDSATGSWHVIGRLPLSDEFYFDKLTMVYCKGCFYGLMPSGILMMSNVLVGQNMQWTVCEYPDPPNRDGGWSGRQTEEIDWHLVATREAVFLVGVVFKIPRDIFGHEVLDVVLWRFHPPAPANSCWEAGSAFSYTMCLKSRGDFQLSASTF